MTSPRQRKKKLAILKLRDKQKQQDQFIEPEVIVESSAITTEVIKKPVEQKTKETQKTSSSKVKKEGLRKLSQTTQELDVYEPEEKKTITKSFIVEDLQQKTEETSDEV